MELLKERQLLPGFRLKSVTGEHIGPQDFRGKKNLVILFFDINCDECGQFLEDMAERYIDYIDANAEILVVGNAPESDLQDIVDGLGLAFPVLTDPEGIVLNQYSYGVPTVIVTDRYSEIRMVERLSDTGHLPDQDKIIARVQLNELECPECGVATWPV